MSFFQKLTDGLRKTRDNIAWGLSGKKLTEDFYETLEETLLLSDAGADTTLAILDQLRRAVKENHVLDELPAMELLREIIALRMASDEEMNLSGSPAVLLLIGVNGTGKTTTAGKLANLYRNRGYSVLLAAADTFRAAAVDQLRIWAQRSGVDMIEGANDPSAVIYDAVSAAKARGIDLVIADTAGRLQTKKNLMDELSKMSRTVSKASPQASMEVLLVLDAVTGQNALSQAAKFADSAGVSGIVLTKLDGTAKGGSVLSVKDRLGIPVRFIGVGEKIDDLDEFIPSDFAEALFPEEPI